MKRIYAALAIVAIVGLAVLVEAGANGIDNMGDEFAEKWQKFKHMWRHMGKERQRHNHMMEHAWRNMLNATRMEGVLEYNNGSYYIDTTPLYLGNEYFMNSIAKSDYDGDGNYEYVWQEMEGLIGSNIVVNGVLRNGTLYVSHINGIWLRAPRETPELVEMSGILEYNNGSYYVDGKMLIIKHGFSKSDIDRDGSLERMDAELQGLIGEQITVDGFMNEKGFVVMHINGIWAR
ncbi:MAG: hypothetical protein J7L58_04445 [Thermoplasmata archaeon]|nr:hypothetical protein [Thermoplasmata archaeon]